MMPIICANEPMTPDAAAAFDESNPLFDAVHQRPCKIINNESQRNAIRHAVRVALLKKYRCLPNTPGDWAVVLYDKYGDSTVTTSQDGVTWFNHGSMTTVEFTRVIIETDRISEELLCTER